MVWCGVVWCVGCGVWGVVTPRKVNTNWWNVWWNVMRHGAGWYDLRLVWNI